MGRTYRKHSKRINTNFFHPLNFLPQRKKGGGEELFSQEKEDVSKGGKKPFSYSFLDDEKRRRNTFEQF